MIGLLACLYALGVTAQERKLRVHVQNEDYYEMDSAKVTVIGTGKSYYTDKHGYVMINDMPLVLDSLEVTKGRRYGKVAPTIQVKMFPEVMKPFSWFVKAGFGCFVPGMELEEFSPEFFIGGGADIRLSRMMAFQPAIHFVYRKGSCYDYDSWYDDETGDYIYADKSTYEIGTLEIPLLLSWKLPLNQHANLQFQFGPYVDLGLWGNFTREGHHGYNTSDPSYDYYEVESSEKLFGSRFTGGGAFGIGVEFKHYIIGTISRVGVTSWEHNQAFYTIQLELGYKF